VRRLAMGSLLSKARPHGQFSLARMSAPRGPLQIPGHISAEIDRLAEIWVSADKVVLRAVKPISHSQPKGSFGADSGPSRGSPRCGALRAYRPFTGLILKGSKGANLRVCGVSGTAGCRTESDRLKGAGRAGLWLITNTAAIPPEPEIRTLHGIRGKASWRCYAELRIINRASRRSAEFLFAPSAIPCMRRPKLRVASRSTSCATVVSEGQAY
jgi:hypothetical protein